MKKVFLSMAAMSLLLASCGGDKVVESEDAKVVVDKTVESTVEYATVKEGSKVNWKASHLLGVDPHNGFISLNEGSLKATDGALTNGSFVLDITSLTDEDIENAEKRASLEGHLKSSDFFNAEAHPTAKFEITEAVATEGDFNTSITGNLTLKDSTRSVTFKANTMSTDDSYTIKSEKFDIDRTQWGMHYGAEGTPNLTEDKIIANAVQIEIDVTLTK